MGTALGLLGINHRLCPFLIPVPLFNLALGFRVVVRVCHYGVTGVESGIGGKSGEEGSVCKVGTQEPRTVTQDIKTQPQINHNERP